MTDTSARYSRTHVPVETITPPYKIKYRVEPAGPTGQVWPGLWEGRIRFCKIAEAEKLDYSFSGSG